MRFLIRLLISAAALWVATEIVPGVHYEGELIYLLLVALVFGLLNALVRPLLLLLSCPVLILTLGLFTLVINALMLMLTGWFSDRLNLGFHVAGFWPAFWGGLVVSIVSLTLSIFVKSRRRTEVDVV